MLIYLEFLTDKEIGERIREARLKRGLTQSELGERLGVGAAAVNKWELGTVTNIKRSVLRDLAVELKILPATLIGLKVNASKLALDDFTDDEKERINDFAMYVKSKRGASE